MVLYLTYWIPARERIWFCNTLATYGVFLWLPKILREASGWSGFRLAAITAAPFVTALAGMVLIGRHSDVRQERKWHVAACALTAALGLVFAASFPTSVRWFRRPLGRGLAPVHGPGLHAGAALPGRSARDRSRARGEPASSEARSLTTLFPPA